MSKITRYDGDVKPFASSSQGAERTIFGEVTQSDELTDQITTSFLRGWGIVGPNENPSLQDFSAAMFTSTKFIAYLHQMGVAEWNATQEYPTDGAMCVHNGLPWVRGDSWVSGDEPGVSNSWSTFEVLNRFKANQKWNVIGSTGKPLPSASPTLYVVGDEVVAGVTVITTNADQITYVAGVLNSGNNTGILRRRYAKDAAGLITKTSQYGGIKLPDGSQLKALVDNIATNGVRITEDGSDVVVDVDLSVITTGFRFFGLSNEVGVWADINDDESGKNWVDVTLSRTSGVEYTNSSSVGRYVSITNQGTGVIGPNVSVSVGGTIIANPTQPNDGGEQVTTFYVPPWVVYSVTITNSTFKKWSEL